MFDRDEPVTNPLEIAWLAGLLEGEGSFLFTMVNDHRKSRPTPRLVITVSMTDYDVLQHVAEVMGTKIQGPYTKKGGNHLVYQTRAVGYRAERIMRSIAGYMGHRRFNDIMDALEAWEKRTIKHEENAKAPRTPIEGLDL